MLLRQKLVLFRLLVSGLEDTVTIRIQTIPYKLFPESKSNFDGYLLSSVIHTVLYSTLESKQNMFPYPCFLMLWVRGCAVLLSTSREWLQSVYFEASGMKMQGKLAGVTLQKSTRKTFRNGDYTCRNRLQSEGYPASRKNLHRVRFCIRTAWSKILHRVIFRIR